MKHEFRRGDLVEVKGPGEILATLDDEGALENLPFMPEMAALCGRRFSVQGRAERICDTVHYTGTRHLADTVLLDDLRCDGSAHGGCQAECRHFWKEEWLRPVDAEAPLAKPDPKDVESLIERASRGTKRTVEIEGRKEERYRCQSTDLPVATDFVRLWDPRSYLRELTCGNVTFGHFLQVMGRAVVEEPMRKLGLIDEIHLRGTRSQPVTDPRLDLQPGEWVQVKSREEIAATLGPNGRNKGLWFDREMMFYFGRTFQVRRRVGRFINDQDGKMIELKNDCVTLEGAVCTGDRSLRRWFCPRAILPYWREVWLRRVEAPAEPNLPTRSEVSQ